MNPVAENELEAIKAIFGNDYSSRFEHVQRAWKSPIKQQYHTIRITARELVSEKESTENMLQGLVSVDLEWIFTDYYPDEKPIWKLVLIRGVGEGYVKGLNEILEQLMDHLLGSEMIYELVNTISDYITEHNSIIIPSTFSAHDIMESRNLEESHKSLMETGKEAARLEQKKGEQDLYLQEIIKQEIQKKQMMKKDEKEKRKKKDSLSLSVGNPINERTISNCTISPIEKGSENCHIAWCIAEPSLHYLVETNIIEIQDEKQVQEVETSMKRATSFLYANAPVIYDWDISITQTTLTLRILTNDFKHISVKDLLALGETLSIPKVISILSSFLTLSDEMQNDFIYTNVDHIWFDGQGKVTFDSLLVPFQKKNQFTMHEKYPSWKVPKTPACQIGILLLEMIAGDLSQFSNPLECAVKLYKLNRDLGDFIQLSLEPNTKLLDLKGHPFFHSDNQGYPKLDMAVSSSIQADLPLITAPKEINSVSRYHSDFEEIEFLGRGGFGSVLKVRNLVDGRYYAVKKIRLNPLDSDASKRLIREVQTLSRLQSEYIVRYYQAWFEEANLADYSSGSSEESVSFSANYSDSDALSDDYESDDWLSSNPLLDNTPKKVRLLRSDAPQISNVTLYTQVLYIQMEFCDKKTLRDVIDSGIQIDQAWIYLRHLLEGLGHLHESGVIHRDLKPSNIFLDTEKRVKIGDFGLATAKKDTSKNTALSIEGLTNSSNAADSSLTSEVGTPVYIAPEIMNGVGRYNSKVDIYSLGVVFFEMIYSMKTQMQRMQILRELRKDEIIFPADFEKETLADAATIIRMMLDHKPRSRPSCYQLLQSPLIPASIEEEYINEDLLRIVKQRNPTYFNRLVSTLFQQVTGVHKDFTYDYNGNQIFNPTASIVSSLMHIHSLRVFRRHGAVQITCPIVLPKSQFTEEVYYSKKTADFLDINGDVIVLQHDLTFPFARSLAQNNEEGITFPIKRFTIDKVYRNNVAGGQPRFIEEADFDIVYEKTATDRDMVPEAEVLKVALEILEFGQIHRFNNLNDFQIRVNYSQIIKSILASASVSDHLSTPVLECISLFKKPLSLGQVKQNLIKIGLQKEAVEKIMAYDISISLSSQTTVSSLEPFLNAECAQELISLVTNLETMGVSNSISLDPLFVYNQLIFNGLFFQICKRTTQSKLDVIAAGGRYESLIEKIRSPFINRKDLHAVGINIAFSKIVSNISNIQDHFQNEEKIPTSCKKADVILMNMGNNNVLLNAKLSIALDLWTSGINVDISYHVPLTNIEDILKYRHDYSSAIVLKPKGTDSFTIKVRNLLNKTEVEVQRSGIISLVQSLLQKQFPKSSSAHQSFENDVEAINSPILIANNSLKPIDILFVQTGIGKKRGKVGKPAETQNWILSEKANTSSHQQYQRSKMLVVDLCWNDICRLYYFWQQHDGDAESLLKKIKVDAGKEYLLTIKKQINKISNSSSSDEPVNLIWIYSASDQRCLPVSRFASF